jgi:hypothetical protein
MLLKPFMNVIVITVVLPTGTRTQLQRLSALRRVSVSLRSSSLSDADVTPFPANLGYF